LREKKVRTPWDAKQEKWYFSIIDVIAVLTESTNPRKYWSVLKARLKAEGSQLATNCSQLKNAVYEPVTNCYHLKKDDEKRKRNKDI